MPAKPKRPTAKPTAAKRSRSSRRTSASSRSRLNLLNQPSRFSVIAAAAVAFVAGALGIRLLTTSQAAGAAAVKSGLIASSFSTGGKVLCLDDYQNSSANGTPITIYPCNRSDQAQNWTLYNDNTIHIHGKCLDVKGQGTADGSVIDLYTCNGGANQKWSRGTNVHLSLNNLVGSQSGKCLDDTNYGSTSGVHTQLYTCNGGTAQVWGWVTSADPIAEGGETRFANCHGSVVGGNTCYYWVGAFQKGNSSYTATGVSANLTVGNPATGHQWPGDGGLLHHSDGEIWAAAADSKQIIEIGWYKDPNHSASILFATRWLNGAAQYVENGGTGFVQVSSSVHFGDTVTAGSSGNYKIQLSGTQWQLWYNGTEVGYFPQSVWSSKGASFSAITQVQVYGEVSSGAYTVSQAQMGNGNLGTSAAAVKASNYTLIGATTPAQLVNFYQPQSPANTAYNFGRTSATGFSFGGPGL